MNSNDEVPQFEKWVEKTLDLRMNAEAIVTDKKERRTPSVWKHDLAAEEEIRDPIEEAWEEIEEQAEAEDEMILSIQADIDDQILRTLSYVDLKEKHGDTEILFMAIAHIIDTAMRYSLPYLGDYIYGDHVELHMRVTRELYRRLELPWTYDDSLPIPEN